MDVFWNLLPNDSLNDCRMYVLDPLSVIIKLAILQNKPVGTKLRIDNNVIYMQEPGMFQSLCRYWMKNNKTDLQYLYNPVEIACSKYLSPALLEQHPKLKDLFVTAQQGLQKLAETYKQCTVIRLCLNHYCSLIANHLCERHNDRLFKKDGMSPLYNAEHLEVLKSVWTTEKLAIVLELTTFLSSDDNAEANVKSLETIMEGIDRHVRILLH